MYTVEFLPSALEDLQALRKFDQQTILARVESQRLHTPATVTRHRKQLQPNSLADGELRVGRFRVFYTVEGG